MGHSINPILILFKAPRRICLLHLQLLTGAVEVLIPVLVTTSSIEPPRNLRLLRPYLHRNAEALHPTP